MEKEELFKVLAEFHKKITDLAIENIKGDGDKKEFNRLIADGKAIVRVVKAIQRLGL